MLVTKEHLKINKKSEDDISLIKITKKNCFFKSNVATNDLSKIDPF